MQAHELDKESRRSEISSFPSSLPGVYDLIQPSKSLTLCHSLTYFLPLLSFHEGQCVGLQVLAFYSLQQRENFSCPLGTGHNNLPLCG